MKKCKILIFMLLFISFSLLLFAQAPEWQWATQAGGITFDKGNGIAIDDDENSYVTGRFSYTATFGSYSLTSSGDSDIFVAKMDATGNWLWATKAGGSDYDEAKGITIDDNGNSYVTGYFNDTVTFGSYSLTSSGDYDIFVAKMDANGNWLWATKAGGSDYDNALGITIDDNGNSYMTGYFRDTATFGSYSLTSSGLGDIYVAKMDANGNWLWATKAGGGSSDYGNGITIDNNGNSYVTGTFSDTATFGPHSITSNGGYDIFVAKMDVAGNWMRVVQAGGIGNDYSSGSSDIFVAKLGNDTSVDNEVIPTKMELSNYPNPFNPNTTIKFELPLNITNPILEIFNIKGQLIDSFILTENQKSLQWNAEDHSSGIYLYHIKGDNQIFATSKMVLLK